MTSSTAFHSIPIQALSLYSLLKNHGKANDARRASLLKNHGKANDARRASLFQHEVHPELFPLQVTPGYLDLNFTHQSAGWQSSLGTALDKWMPSVM
jgi:hypothetical protein